MKRNFIAKILFIFIIAVSFNLNVFADDYIEDDSILDNLENMEVSSTITTTPNINARHATVYDRSSGRILYGKNENESCKMASTTKIMTSIIVIEKVPNLKETLTISKKAASTGGSRLGLSTNDQITVENLLYGLMMRSGNDDAVA